MSKKKVKKSVLWISTVESGVKLRIPRALRLHFDIKVGE